MKCRKRERLGAPAPIDFNAVLPVIASMFGADGWARLSARAAELIKEWPTLKGPTDPGEQGDCTISHVPRRTFSR
jgi:hypothetical protein